MLKETGIQNLLLLKINSQLRLLLKTRKKKERQLDKEVYIQLYIMLILKIFKFKSQKGRRVLLHNKIRKFRI
ncbi:hypothetical protein MA16_Dca027221 [Dendrobium catenatum]|uniref:Uncharacterized protein n=1 Tax=Dendrobium catenatum TaxID=906689 RepID=A0A2I0WHU4_9ASPA|nr:hypothetical protein MA16_Dca027221 [Dendrobium catenatum]